MALGVRGFNPIWFLVDLVANPFDDTFWMYVLENTIPYVPTPVYHDAELQSPWDNPIQFLGNGTLPVDIFWNPDRVYKLEFRQNDGVLPPSQSDPLIYEVNDYIPGDEGGTPVDDIVLATDNQVSNPQFSLVNFVSPHTLTSVTNPDPIDIGGGWFLELAGTGNVTMNQVALNDDNINPSNAPYALRLTLSGWNADGVVLRQRFQQNGMLWASKNVSSTLTARLEGSPQPVRAIMIDSNGATLGEVLNVPAINEAWNEFTGHAEFPATTNPDLPPSAYVDYHLILPSTVDIYVTSIQLIAQDLPLEPKFEQDTIDRQLDHTFHYYKDSILLMPKSSILTGWNFGQNPWQTRTTTLSNFATFGYAADQTIIIQQRYVQSATNNNIQVGRADAAHNFGFEVVAVTATNQFAAIQYIEAQTMRQYWGYIMSSLVKLSARKQTPARDLFIKMRLIHRNSNPSAVSQTEPISAWTAGSDPTFGAGWTVLTPKNDPIYNLANGVNEIKFEGFQLPSGSTAIVLGIVIYTITDMVETGTPDNIIFNDISLAPNHFAIESNVLTFDETLLRCQFYLEKSYNIAVLPGAVSGLGELIRQQRIAGGNELKPAAFNVEFNTRKRSSAYTLTLYSNTGTPGAVLGVLYNDGAPVASVVDNIANWTLQAQSETGFFYSANGNNTIVAAVANEGFIAFQYVANARLGV